MKPQNCPVCESLGLPKSNVTIKTKKFGFTITCPQCSFSVGGFTVEKAVEKWNKFKVSE